MAGVEEIVSEIMAQHKGLRREEVNALIEAKRADSKGLLSEQGAARLVAEELLVQMEAESQAMMDLQNVVPGLNDVTVTVRVMMSWPPQSFQRRDGTVGQVMRFAIADKTGQAVVVAWDKKADEISKLNELQGQIVRIEHAYTREGLSGRPELHLGERSAFVLNPSGSELGEIPEFHELLNTIAQITEETSEINLQGIVQAEPRSHAFQRNGREGLVTRTILADSTGSMQVVFWNERAADVEGLKSGDLIRVLHARARKNNAGNLEVHVESRSQVTVLERAPSERPQSTAPVMKLRDLKGGMMGQTIRVQVVRKNEVREVKRLTGETVKVGRILVGDDTALAALSLWDTAADITSQVKEGDVFVVQGVSVRERYGEISLNAGKNSQIQIEATAENAEPVSAIRKVSELENAKNLVGVEGTLIEEPTVREVLTSQGENVQVGTLRLGDDTGDVRVTLWRQNAQLASKLRKGMKVRIFGLRVRTGLGDATELSSGPVTVLELVQGMAQRPAWQDIKQIIALKEGESLWVRGLVLETPEAFTYLACAKCNQRFNIHADEIACGSCGYSGQPQIRLAMKMKLDDGTGVLDVQADMHELDQILGESAAWTVKEMKSKRSTRLPLPPMIIAPIAGKKIEAYGAAERSLQTGKPIFHSSKAMLVE